jgi:hypothetical protein
VEIKEVLQLPFLQVALPIMVNFAVTMWHHSHSINKRIDDLRSDMNPQFGEVTKHLDKIDAKLENHGGRITRLKERTNPLAGRR